MRFSRMLALCLTLPSLALAGTASLCQALPGLSQGINLQNFHACEVALDHCLKTGPYPSSACVDQTLHAQASCQAVKTIADHLQAPAFNMQAVLMGNLVVLTIHYPADGQTAFHVVTPQGCLIDPLKVDRVKPGWILSTTGTQPSYLHFPQGQQVISFPVKISQGCLSCAVLGQAKVNLQFSKNGGFWGSILRDVTLTTETQ